MSESIEENKKKFMKECTKLEPDEYLSIYEDLNNLFDSKGYPVEVVFKAMSFYFLTFCKFNEFTTKEFNDILVCFSETYKESCEDPR
jgi:hypothetical protein